MSLSTGHKSCYYLHTIDYPADIKKSNSNLSVLTQKMPVIYCYVEKNK